MRLIPLIACILSFLCSSVSAQRERVQWDFLPGRGWRITHRVTHPGETAGTEIVLEATAVYYNNMGEKIGESQSEPLVLVVGHAVWRREWEYTLRPGFQAAIDSTAGDGGMELSWPKLKIWVNVPNDGKEHTFSWILSSANLQ